jgi:RNA polymerase sigma-70 factor (sigma-E family)
VRHAYVGSICFDEYVAARGGVLLRFAYLICGDRHLAEDLVQEALIKAHRRWSGIEADNPDAYVKQTLVRTHVSWLRRRASSEIAMETLPEGAGGHGFDDAHASREELWALLARLPRAQRAVLVLRYFEDLDDHRIADLVGVSASTVRVHAHRGLHALRETLAQHADDAPSGAGMLENVRRGAARAAKRRRAAVAGGLAAAIAAVLIAVPLLRSESDGPPPVEPSVSPSPSSNLELAPTALVGPAFPYAFGYLPPGLEPGYVGQQLLMDQPRVMGTYLRFGEALSIAVGADASIQGDAGETDVASTVIVNGEPATLWTTPGTPGAALDWQRDGLWFIAGTDGTVSVEDLVRFADSMAPGSTPSAKAGPIDEVVSVALPPGYTVNLRYEDRACAQSVPAAGSSICITLLAERLVAPHNEDLTVNGDPAYTIDHALIVERSDGRIVMISYDYGIGLTTEDLIAIYRGITFEQ